MLRSTRELHDAEQQDLTRGKLSDEAMHLLTSPDQERMSACAATVDLTALLNPVIALHSQHCTWNNHAIQP